MRVECVRIRLKEVERIDRSGRTVLWWRTVASGGESLITVEVRWTLCVGSRVLSVAAPVVLHTQI